MSRQRIAVIDFDGTIVEHRFPAIGEPMPEAFEVMKELKEAGWALILWTCRENDGHNINRQYLKEAVDFCRENGVEFDGVNETPLEFEFRDERTLRRKVYGDVYIDDRNLGGLVDWYVVREVLLEGKMLDWHTFDPNDPRGRA
tara:strand:- start:160 stop:588 length:429 start_codon:yes stop_codon:yes gene_type:complete